jgi:hypothetical protein
MPLREALQENITISHRLSSAAEDAIMGPGQGHYTLREEMLDESEQTD